MGRTFPRDSEGNKKQGVRQKKKDAAVEKRSSKDDVDKEREKLERHVILKNLDPKLQQAYKRFKTTFNAEMLVGLVGLEYTHLAEQRDSMPSARHSTQMVKVLETLRRLIAMREGSDVYIPDAVTFTIAPAEDKEDFSDEPEFE